jgi:AraC family transcriptional regulator
MPGKTTPTPDEQAGPGRREPRIEHKDAFLVAGLRYEGRNEQGEIPAMWDRFIPRAGELVADPSRLVAYGVARALPRPEVEGAFEYLAGVEVDSLDDLPSDMVGWEIPALTYAVLPAHGFPEVGATCDYFCREWLPKSKEYEEGEGLMIEHYPETFSQDLIIYLWFPVERK